MPISGFANDTWIEVLRYSADPGQMGFWMFYAPGSGIRFHLGRTIAFLDHNQAGQHLGAKSAIQIAERALALGYDSVQFTRFVEHNIMKLEILFPQVNTIGSSTTSTEQCVRYKSRFSPFAGCSGWDLKHVCRNDSVISEFDSHGRYRRSKSNPSSSIFQ